MRTQNIHARMRAQVEELQAGATEQPKLGPQLGPDDDLTRLLDAAVNAIAEKFPERFVFEGRTYWLRADLMLLMDVFDRPTSKYPMFTSVAQGGTLGHASRPK